MEIKSLDQLIGPLLVDGKKYVSCETKSLLSSGENYGSLMLDVRIKLEKDGQEEIVCCVAKLVPLSEVIWKIFNTPVTFKKEIAVYQEIVPTLNRFGKEKGINNITPFFAKCVGARVSLDPSSDQVDKDAVLLLENIKLRGFDTADRFQGFNKEEAELILKDLSTFHAVPLALKLQKPEEFMHKIRPHLNKDFTFAPESDVFNHFLNLVKEKTSADPRLASLYLKYVENAKRSLELLKKPLEPNELYATMAHNDFWVNNTMLRYENGKPVENIMVDFQVLEYNSPSTDLVFFLYSSVQLEALENNVDYFFKYYFDHFIDTLQKLGCDTHKMTFSSFLEDLNNIARDFQVHHVIGMLLPIYTKKGEAKDLSTLKNEGDIIVDHTSLHENYTRKLLFALEDFDRRGWL